MNALKQAKRPRLLNQKKIGIVLVVFVVLAAAVAVGAFYYNLQITRLNDQIAQAQSYITDAQNADKLTQISELSTKLQQQVNYNSVLEQYDTAFKSTYHFSSDTLKKINKLLGKNHVTFQALSYEENKVSLKCAAPDSVSAADFAKDLEENILKNVSFTGYSVQAAENASIYSFTVEGNING